MRFFAALGNCRRWLVFLPVGSNDGLRNSSGKDVSNRGSNFINLVIIFLQPQQLFHIHNTTGISHKEAAGSYSNQTKQRFQTQTFTSIPTSTSWSSQNSTGRNVTATWGFNFGRIWLIWRF